MHRRNNFFFLPGIIWFYYGSEQFKCKSPIDGDIHTMIICYFVVGLLLIIPFINALLGRYTAHDCAKFILAAYLTGKLAVQIIMIINVQIDYNAEVGWDETICPNLEPLILFWLIWNYINICITFIYFITYIAIGWCECIYYEDYDFE